MDSSDSASRDLFDIICDNWPLVLPKIELLLKAGANFNIPYYDGRQDEWTALDELLHYQCLGTKDLTWHDYMSVTLQLFLKYRGFEAFVEEDLDERFWSYECDTCQQIVSKVILRPYRAQKWLNFCASGPVVRLCRQSLLFDKHLLYLIREFAE